MTKGVQCKCKKGYRSEVDLKCSNCRTKAEDKAFHEYQRKRAAGRKQLNILVINRHHQNVKGSVYIGRGSPLGNKWSWLDKTPPQFKVASREEAIAYYRKWLREQIDGGNSHVINELQRLAGMAVNGSLVLECFCVPLACHGEVIKSTIEEAILDAYPEFTK